MLKFKEMSKRAKLVLNITAVLAWVNFIAFWLVAVYLGGDALNGHVQEQHYFICAHGSCHEVTQTLWNYSYWHAISGMGGILLVFLELVIFTNPGDITFDFNSST